MRGFCAETGGGVTQYLTTQVGVLVSTTHTITGAIVGVDTSRRVSAVRGGVAKDIITAWIVALSAAGIVAGLFNYLGFWMT